eukprot:TRINITY_DN4098_c0_g1_i1.p1 TRINITY_DN4098_c0_g1~~TRINITY_DN4098_c0_g1_i1.p1  ORF type:complete len:1328 (+),score=290.97 TRINITY_DN4098_c0_g1_i1:798-4781(+)
MPRRCSGCFKHERSKSEKLYHESLKMQPKRPPPMDTSLPAFPSFLDYSKKKGNLISFRCYVEAFTKFSVTILVTFPGSTTSGSGIRNVWGSIMSQNLPVALVSVNEEDLEELLLGLGPEICSTSVRNKLKMNTVLCASLAGANTAAAPIWKRLEAATKIVKANSCSPIIIYSPDFYDTPGLEASFLESRPPVVSCEKRLLGFCQNQKIFWIGSSPIDHLFKIQCAIQGTTILEIPNSGKFWDLLPYDFTGFVNNNPGFRIVFTLENQSKDTLHEFLAVVQSKKLTIPVLLWANSNEPPQLTDKIWDSFNRLWCTSRSSVLLEYAKSNVDLRWAPDLRYGRLYSQDWTGTISVKDIVGRTIGIMRGGKQRDPFVTVAVGDQLFKTEPVKKEINPRWSSLNFFGKCNADSTLVFLISEREKPNVVEGRVEIPMKKLLSEVSCRGVPYLLKTFAVKKEVSKESRIKSSTKKKDLANSAGGSSSTLNESVISGTLTVTFIFNSDTPARRDTVPDFETLSYYDLWFNNTDNFLTPFPTTSNLLTSVATNPERIKKCLQFAGNTRSILHGEVVGIIKKFLAVKRAVGSEVEKKLYKHMTVESFVTRISTKRALVFYLASDETLLRDGTRYRDWAKVGTDNEGHLHLCDNLSYDEMLISALYAVACPTFFINAGERRNCGKLAEPEKYEPEGVLVALVGARFEHNDKMESTLMVITPACSESNGFGAKGDMSSPQAQVRNIWAGMYGVEEKGSTHLPSWNEVLNETKNQKPEGESRWRGLKYMKINDERYLNVQAYKKRMRLTAETFLFAADRYARDAKKTAYCHVIGLGLGAWGISTFQDEQAEMILSAYHEALLEWSFPAISDLDFSWFPGNVRDMNGIESGDAISIGGNTLNIRFSRRNPSDPLNNPNKLLVAQYAWDSNSFPGNEYWLGSQFLGLSSDPAAACCSLIPQLQNPAINPSFVARPPLLFGNGTDSILQDAWKKPINSVGSLNLVHPKPLIPTCSSPPISDDEYLSFVDEESVSRNKAVHDQSLPGFLDFAPKQASPHKEKKSKPVAEVPPSSDDEEETPTSVPTPTPTVLATPTKRKSTKKTSDRVEKDSQRDSQKESQKDSQKDSQKTPVVEPPVIIAQEHYPQEYNGEAYAEYGNDVEAGSGESQPAHSPATIQELQAKMEAEMQAKLAAMQIAMEREMQARLSYMLTNPNAAAGAAPAGVPPPGYPMGAYPQYPGYPGYYGYPPWGASPPGVVPPGYPMGPGGPGMGPGGPGMGPGGPGMGQRGGYGHPGQGRGGPGAGQRGGPYMGPGGPGGPGNYGGQGQGRPGPKAVKKTEANEAP